MTLISVIIPVHNVEKYLPRCLDSVINQTYKDIEIICINDGSTDNSLKVLNEYAQNDNRIKIINREHSGPSASRNAGIKVSKGEYIIFVDSDDWIENNLAELALDKISKNNADIVIYGHNRVEGNKITPHDFSLEILKYYENKNILIAELASINHCIWDKMIRKKFLTDNNILFPAEITQNEDGIFNLICLYHNPKYCCLPYTLYNYLSVRKDSIMNNFLRIIKNDILSCKYFITTDIYKNASEEYKVIVLNKFLKNLLFNYKQKKYKFYKLIYIYQLNQFMKYLSKNLDKNLLNATEYPTIQKIFSFKKYFFEHLFSVKNENNAYIKRKCITICFVKLKFSPNADKKEIKNFSDNQVSENSILIIEPNNCHGETIPGFAKMFSELGYKTDIIVTPHVYKENPFCRLDSKYYHNIFQLSLNGIKKILNSSKIKDYKYVYFNSYHIYCNSTRLTPIPIFKFFSEMISPGNCFIAMEHHLDMINTNMNKEKRILQLGNIKPDVAFCNSHYFGEIQNHEKNRITNFVIVGEVKSYRKNFDLLIESLKELINSTEDFHIDIIGNGKFFIPLNLQKYITFHGRLPFDKMFSYVEKSDFILTLLDPDNDTHLRYITDGTSGTFQLSYGFCKPILIHSEFAEKHYFNDKNSIIYNKNFTQSLEKCINMSDDEYGKYIECLKNTSKDIENISLKNLKDILEANNS